MCSKSKIYDGSWIIKVATLLVFQTTVDNYSSKQVNSGRSLICGAPGSFQCDKLSSKILVKK